MSHVGKLSDTTSEDVRGDSFTGHALEPIKWKGGKRKRKVEQVKIDSPQPKEVK